MKKNCIMVVGSGRSGTSLVANVLQAMGARLSGDLIGSSEQNPGGAFEDKEIFDITHGLIADINYSVHLPLEADWIACKEVKKVIAKLTKIVAQRVDAQDGIWCFKDPKSALLIPMWAQVFNRANVVPKYILAVRDPRHVCESMHRQYGIDYRVAETSWMLRNVSALWDAGGRCYILHYEDWCSDPEGVMTGLSEFCGLSAEGVDLSNVYNADFNRAQYTDYAVENRYINELYNQLKNYKGASSDRKGLMEAVSKCREMMQQLTGFTSVSKTLLDNMRKRIRQLEPLKKTRGVGDENASDMERLILENNNLLVKSKDLTSELELYRKRGYSNTGTKIKDAQNNGADARGEAIEESTSFRLGNMIVKAFKQPGRNTIALPYRLVSLVFSRKGSR